MSGEDEEYVIPPGGGVPWRDLSMAESNRPADRDIHITEIERFVLRGNFPWSLVRVHTDAGITGLGETFVGEETSDIAARYEELLVGQNPLDINRLADIVEQRRTGIGSFGRAALAGIEIALWDIKGKLLGVPVYELLGGKYRDTVTIYCDTHAGESLGKGQRSDPKDVYTPESYARAAREVVDEGFTALKFDLDVPSANVVDTAARRLDNAAIEHKASLIAAAREAIGSDIDLGVDLHWNFTTETAIRLGKAIEPYDLAWLEDPVPPEKTAAHRRVTEALDTPIMTGENITTVAGFHELFSNDGVDIASPDVQKSGGLADLVEIANMADLFGIPIAPHNIASPVGTIAGVHFAAAIPNFIALEFHARDVPWWEDLIDWVDYSGGVIEDGSIRVPEAPGLGIELNEEVAKAHLTEEFAGAL